MSETFLALDPTRPLQLKLILNSSYTFTPISARWQIFTTLEILLSVIQLIESELARLYLKLTI
ncbi:MAG: hypothetical protein Kow0029_19650 [Candidatus Rifleibacteriota bacterium]